ncbi:MAG: hypothetical protein IPL28_27375 [Chloroflexi bacterium]|nr:hypothetical protein [Chloroflexota bacterium]
MGRGWGVKNSYPVMTFVVEKLALLNRRTPAQYVLYVALLVLFTAVTRFIYLGQLPPGLWFDEAWVSVVARGNETPVYFAANFGGMHPAVVYLTRAAQQISQDPLTIRYALAAVSTLTIALAVWAYRQLAAEEQGATQIALLTAFILGITYPFFHFSRLGYESSLPVSFALLTFAFLGRYFQNPTQPTRTLLLVGFMCGLSLYSFGSGRFIPIAVAVAYGWHWAAVVPRRPWRTAVGHFALIVSAAVLTAAPLLRYFWLNWSQFTLRASVTASNTLGAGATSIPLALLGNLGRALAGLFLPGWGDELARHNLPGRPVFDWFLALLFLLGVALLVQRPRSTRTILLFSWVGMGLLPAILTDNPATYTRIFVAVPALAAVAAVGAIGLWRWLERYGQGVATAVLVGGLAFSTASTLYDYFGRWAAVPQLYDDFQVGVWQAGQMALAKSETETVFLVPDAIDLSNPTLALLLADSAVRTHPPAPCFYYPAAQSQPTTYLINNLVEKEMALWVRQHWPQTAVTGEVRHSPTGDIIYTALTVPQGEWPQGVATPLEATFANSLHLRGTHIAPQPTSLLIDLWWEALAVPTADHTLFLHLYPTGAEDSPPLAQLDIQPCWPTSQWESGVWLHDQYAMALPPDLPAGSYTLALGWYTYPTFERLNLQTTAPLSANRLLLATLDLDE